MFERYTERARRVVFFARYEASQFGSLTIETEHLLLGLLREDRNIISRFLPEAASAETVRDEIAQRVTIREKVPTSADLPLSDECKRILAYSAEEAERLNHRHIGTEHLLLGILREEKCVAAQVLSERSLKLNSIREELARALVSWERGATSHELRPFFSFAENPALPKSGVVPDGDTARRIAEAVWIPLYGAETVTGLAAVQVELKHNIWVVTGPPGAEGSLFAFILKTDGRIVSVGRGVANL
jgi:hypothetical protein